MQNGKGREVVIVEAARTPIGRGHPEKGYYKDTHPNELLGKAFSEVISRAGIPAEAVEDVITGCVQQMGEQGFNVGRNAWLQAGLPETTPATTVDRQRRIRERLRVGRHRNRRLPAEGLSRPRKRRLASAPDDHLDPAGGRRRGEAAGDCSRARDPEPLGAGIRLGLARFAWLTHESIG